MENSILIANPDIEWSVQLQTFLKNNNYHNVDTTNFGKECQLQVYKNKYYAVILDLDLQQHSALTVMLYLKLNAPSLKVILTVFNKARLAALELDKDKLRELGACDILIKPFTFEALSKSLQGISHFESWRDIKKVKATHQEEIIQIDDFEFTKIALDDFYSGNTAIYDCYLKLGQNKYVKILHKGDFFDDARIEKYKKSNEVTHLYFKTKDRAIYINFINEILKKLIAGSARVEEKTRAAKVLVENFIDEAYTVGIPEMLMEEGKQVCDNIYNMVKKEMKLLSYLDEYKDYDSCAHSHLFLTAFYATAISSKIDWCTKRTIETIAFGALFHDIGMLKMPLELRTIRECNLSPKHFETIKGHTKAGFEMLDKCRFMTEPIKQIVYQHHELVDGTGYPNGLTGNKIYPLAKIVALADEFVVELMERKIAPFLCLKEFISTRDKIICYDSIAIKALIKCFK